MIFHGSILIMDGKCLVKMRICDFFAGFIRVMDLTVPFFVAPISFAQIQAIGKQATQ